MVLKKDLKFTIHFDVDTDGCTAGAIIYRYLRNFTSNIDYTINIGKKHGLTDSDLSVYKNTNVLIIVDSIDASERVYQELTEMGIQIVILDHHNIPNNTYLHNCCLVSSNKKL